LNTPILLPNNRSISAHPDCVAALFTGVHSFGPKLFASYPRISVSWPRYSGESFWGLSASLPLARYAGTYSDSLYGDVTIQAAGDGLRLKSGTQEGRLEHWQYETFRLEWDNRWEGTALITFVIGNDGTPSRIELGGRAFERADKGR
jgi:hypothetical protein